MANIPLYIYIWTQSIDRFGVGYNLQTYLNSLVFQRFVRIMYVLERNPVELAFVDVGDAVVFTPLGAAARCLQVVFEAIGGKPGAKILPFQTITSNPA